MGYTKNKEVRKLLEKLPEALNVPDVIAVLEAYKGDNPGEIKEALATVPKNIFESFRSFLEEQQQQETKIARDEYRRCRRAGQRDCDIPDARHNELVEQVLFYMGQPAYHDCDDCFVCVEYYDN